MQRCIRTDFHILLLSVCFIRRVSNYRSSSLRSARCIDSLEVPQQSVLQDCEICGSSGLKEKHWDVFALSSQLRSYEILTWFGKVWFC